jgi:hypothetical protein
MLDTVPHVPCRIAEHMGEHTQHLGNIGSGNVAKECRFYGTSAQREHKALAEGSTAKAVWLSSGLHGRLPEAARMGSMSKNIPLLSSRHASSTQSWKHRWT